MADLDLPHRVISVISTVHYDINLHNAYWTGTQMVYGDAYAYVNADDIVAHELTHGVTQSESNLIYLYQSGAINESFSDLWGEYFDQTNGEGNDSPSVKWRLGEDVTGLGAVRNMSNPPEFSDPDRMTSTYYYKGEGDNGGVHTNSGVNNKAVSLMVDGGSFNSKVVKPLGWDKTAAIYHVAQTDLLGVASNYSDLYYALQQACTILIGGHKRHHRR
ncbi:MAG: M4 family metallopeptidase [Anaerolineales bacterium]